MDSDWADVFPIEDGDFPASYVSLPEGNDRTGPPCIYSSKWPALELPWLLPSTSGCDLVALPKWAMKKTSDDPGTGSALDQRGGHSSQGCQAVGTEEFVFSDRSTNGGVWDSEEHECGPGCRNDEFQFCAIHCSKQRAWMLQRVCTSLMLHIHVSDRRNKCLYIFWNNFTACACATTIW